MIHHFLHIVGREREGDGFSPGGLNSVKPPGVCEVLHTPKIFFEIDLNEPRAEQLRILGQGWRGRSVGSVYTGIARLWRARPMIAVGFVTATKEARIESQNWPSIMRL